MEGARDSFPPPPSQEEIQELVVATAPEIPNDVTIELEMTAPQVIDDSVSLDSAMLQEKKKKSKKENLDENVGNGTSEKKKRRKKKKADTIAPEYITSENGETCDLRDSGHRKKKSKKLKKSKSMTVLDSDEETNIQKHRRSISASNIPNQMDYYNQMTGGFGTPVYGGSMGPYGNMCAIPPNVAYYNAPMMAPPPVAYYNQAMTVPPPAYYNYAGAQQAAYMGGEGNYGESKKTETQLEEERKEKALEIFTKSFVLFLNGFLIVSGVIPILVLFSSNTFQIIAAISLSLYLEKIGTESILKIIIIDVNIIRIIGTQQIFWLLGIGALVAGALGIILVTKEINARLTLIKFLQNLFRLFDLESQNYLAQDKWIEHLKGRLTDEKQIDFAEQIESVAYVLCGEGQITFEKFQQIWLAKGIVDKFYRIIDVDATNQISTNQIMEFISNLTNARPRTGFDKTSLERLELLFRKTVGNEKEIRREEFKKIVTSKNPFFTERVFQIFDKDNSGSISLQEFIDAIHQFAGQSPEDKIKFLFKVYDLDGDGLIQHLELQHVMRACMEENGMQFSEEQIEDLTMAMFEDADPNRRGAITYEALKNQLEKHGGLLENLSISIDRWLVPLPQETVGGVSKSTKNMKNKSFIQTLKEKLPYQLTAPYMKNNYVLVVFVVLFTIINTGLFISRAIQYRKSNIFVIFARACGQCLNFNCAWILVLMLRHTLTFLRTRGFGAFLPIDHHIYLHKITGILIAAYSLLHTIMHLINFSVIVVNDPVINANNYTVATWLFTSKPGLFGLVHGWANPTGFLLFFILLIMFICSQPFVRRGGSFEIFYWTHLLYVPFWICVLLHGPNFWKWFIVPGLIYTVERIVRLIWMKSKRGKTYISSGLLLPSKVTHLVIKRPVHFYFRPGDYIFVNIPAIAKYEWHPFTLSSAPEQEDYIWLHIRGVGEWTNRLHEFFEKEQEKLHNGEIEPVIAGTSKVLTQPSAQIMHAQEKKPALAATTKCASLDSPFINSSNTQNKLQDEAVVPARRLPPGTSKLAMDNNTAPKLERQQSESNKTITKIRAQIQRTFSRRDTSKALNGYSNDGFTNDEGGKSTGDKLHKLLFQSKAPLEKSLSMPDMQNKVKKRERMMVLREYMRSESERSFDEVQIKKARMQSLGLAYLSPQNKSLAQSFRYMRNKPTIIAFKTPSLENCEPRDSTNSMVVSPGMYTEKEAEEGKIRRNQNSNMDLLKPTPTVNYPVGKPLEIYIDGPYGAPSSHIFVAQHAVLIGTGIGVTPFASILQSIMHRYWKARHTCPRCNFEWASEIPPTIMNLRKVDFFWINRDQRSFEWFVNLLSQLEIEQAELGGAMERFLDMHMYITSALQKTDMKAVGLQLALDLLHQKEKRDLITGLKTRTNAGRPNWDKVFKQIQAQKKGKVTVFYCGPPQLAKTLRYKCDQYGFAFRKEIF